LLLLAASDRQRLFARGCALGCRIPYTASPAVCGQRNPGCSYAMPRNGVIKSKTYRGTGWSVRIADFDAAFGTAARILSLAGLKGPAMLAPPARAPRGESNASTETPPGAHSVDRSHCHFLHPTDTGHRGRRGHGARALAARCACASRIRVQPTGQPRSASQAARHSHTPHAAGCNRCNQRRNGRALAG